MIKAYDFEDNIDLLAKEKYWMKRLACVNINIPGRSVRTDGCDGVQIKRCYWCSRVFQQQIPCFLINYSIGSN